MNKGTHSATKAEALKGRKWWLVDVSDATVGRAQASLDNAGALL